MTVGGDGVVRFDHPLLASGVYESAAAGRRRRVHARLAESLVDSEERARHLALAAAGPDESTAEALDRATESVAARGAAEAAAELKELALRMTPPEDEAAVARRRYELAEQLLRRRPVRRAAGARASSRSLPPGELKANVLLDLGSVSASGRRATGRTVWNSSRSRSRTPRRRRSRPASTLASR